MKIFIGILIALVLLGISAKGYSDAGKHPHSMPSVAEIIATILIIILVSLIIYL